MPLTDTAIRLAKPTGRDYTLKDGDGLALFVGASGAKNWHFRFSWAGKQPRISLGTYPEISLKEARELRIKPARSSPRASTPASTVGRNARRRSSPPPTPSRRYFDPGATSRR